MYYCFYVFVIKIHGKVQPINVLWQLSGVKSSVSYQPHISTNVVDMNLEGCHTYPAHGLATSSATSRTLSMTALIW